MSGENLHELLQPEPGALEEKMLEGAVQHEVVQHQPPPNHPAKYVKPILSQNELHKSFSFDGSAHIHPEDLRVSHSQLNSSDSSPHQYYSGPPLPPYHHHPHHNHQRYSQYPINAGLAHPQHHSGHKEMEKLRRNWLGLEILFLAFYAGAVVWCYIKRVYIFAILWSVTLLLGLVNTGSVFTRQVSLFFCIFCEGVLVLVAAGSTSYIAISESGWKSWLGTYWWMGIMVLCIFCLSALLVPRLNFRSAKRVSKYRSCYPKYYIAIDDGRIFKTEYPLFKKYESDRLNVVDLTNELKGYSFPCSWCADGIPVLFYLLGQALILFIVLFETSSLKRKLYVW